MLGIIISFYVVSRDRSRSLHFTWGYCKKRPYGLTNKFGNWPFGAYAIRFATGVYKHQSVCMLSGASFINGMHNYS